LNGPNLYVIAGCNGAGKTTAAYTLFPEILENYEFVNADEIARELRFSDPDTSDIKAGRIMLDRISYLLSANKDFAIETTLASKSLLNTVKLARQNNYYVTLVYYWLNSPGLAIERVRSRVEAGGHHIPEGIIYRRYYAGIKNLFKIYIPTVNFWMIFNNSGSSPELVAKGTLTGELEILKSITFTQIISLLSNG